MNFSFIFGMAVVRNLHDLQYPTVPNALSGAPLLAYPVKYRQLQTGNVIHLNNQTKRRMCHFFSNRLGNDLSIVGCQLPSVNVKWT